MNKHLRFLVVIVVCGGLLALAFLTPRTVHAQVGLIGQNQAAEGVGCCSCQAKIQTPMQTAWQGTKAQVKTDVEAKFTNLTLSFIPNTIWDGIVQPALQEMANQFSAIALYQAQIVGSFFDAAHQMETQRSLQQIQAAAHKEYHPSVGVCEFGSHVRSLAASEGKSEANAYVMNARAIDRALGNAHSVASRGGGDDLKARFAQFQNVFCNPADDYGTAKYLCSPAEDRDPARMNKDIDYTRAIAARWTLDVDFTDQELSAQEEDILALAANLYAHDVYTKPAQRLVRGGNVVNGDTQNYMDMRSMLAKRNVAETSFYAQAADKAQGAEGSRAYLEAVLQELGAGTAQDIDALLGDTQDGSVEPSYYAQMEVLSKKIFQNPDFYTNLYDTPVNVRRKTVALQAVGLMQKFDLLKSHLRNEANLSLLLELAVSKTQTEEPAQ